MMVMEIIGRPRPWRFENGMFNGLSSQPIIDVHEHASPALAGLI
jgi:hypothetical protein